MRFTKLDLEAPSSCITRALYNTEQGNQIKQVYQSDLQGASKEEKEHNGRDYEKVRKPDVLDGMTVVRSEKVKDELVLDEIDIELVSRSRVLIN